MTAPPITPRPRHARGPSDTLVGDAVVRFDRAERILHWVTATAVLVAIATGLILYVRPLAVAVGRRQLVRDAHVVAGIAGVVPFLITVLGPCAAGLRRDIRRVARWNDDDVAWFRRRTRPASMTGKFNGGQKLNALLLSSGLVVMAMTGGIMRFFGPFPLAWRSGATFVHDWVSFGLWFLVAAHIVKGLTTAGAMRAMWTGWVDRGAAERRPRWWSTVTGAPPPPGPR